MKLTGPITTGERLTIMRNRASIDAREFAKYIDIDWNVVYRWEHGVVDLTAAHVAQLCETFASLTDETYESLWAWFGLDQA